MLLDKAIDEYTTCHAAVIIFCGNSTSFAVKPSFNSLVIAVFIPYIVVMHVFHGQELIPENIIKKCNASHAAMVIFSGKLYLFWCESKLQCIVITVFIPYIVDMHVFKNWFKKILSIHAVQVILPWLFSVRNFTSFSVEASCSA